MAKYDNFSTESDRKAATVKMANKREKLAVEARELADKGVEFEARELPRSFRPDDSPVPAATVTDKKRTTQVEVAAAHELLTPRHSSPFTGTALDGRLELLKLKHRKTRKEALEAQAAASEIAASGSAS